MPAQFTLPPDNRAIGSGNPPADMNAVVDALTVTPGVIYNVFNSAYAAGDFGAQVNNAIAAADAAGGGLVLIPPGAYTYSTGIVCTGKYVYICGSGRWATQLNYTGSGDAMRVYNTDTTGVLTGGGVRDLTINGSGAGAGACGLHLGDMRATELRLAVQNFSGAGSIGVHLDNQYSWTEQCHGYLWLSNCTQNLVFDVSGTVTGAKSFGYSDFAVQIVARANQDGVVLANGALLYNSRLQVRANFTGSGSVQSNAVLRLIGTVPAGHPGAGLGSRITTTRLDILAECSSGGGSNAPQTINFDVLGTNTLTGCTGILDFTAGTLAFATTNWTSLGAVGSFTYSGFIAGDFNLSNATSGLSSGHSPVLQGAASYAKSLLNTTNGQLSVDAGDFFNTTLTQSITISLNPGGGATFASAQRKTVIIKQAAAGGPFTVTWPHTASPSTTNCTVNWAGGTAPTMTATAGAVDVYKLETYDGATWYGQAIQNVS